MAALIEQRLRELLTEAYTEGFGDGEGAACGSEDGDGGKGYEEAKINKSKAIDDLALEVWKLLTYHAGRGDAAQEYINQFEIGRHSWSKFRWNEVYDRMMSAPAPEHLEVKRDG